LAGGHMADGHLADVHSADCPPLSEMVIDDHLRLFSPPSHTLSLSLSETLSPSLSLSLTL